MGAKRNRKVLVLRMLRVEYLQCLLSVMIPGRIVQSKSTNLDAMRKIKPHPMGERKMEFGRPGKKQETLHQQKVFELALETHEIFDSRNYGKERDSHRNQNMIGRTL